MNASLEARPRVSVIIPHLNTPEALRNCLVSVAGQVLDHGSVEIIVCDNGSTVPMDAVRAAWPQVIFLVEPTPGPGPARNAGVAVARADILAFIDADCRAGTGWLQAAVDAVEPDPARTVVGGDVRIDFIDENQLTATEAYEAVFAYRQSLYIRTQHFSGTGNLAMGRSVHAAVGPFRGMDVAEDRDWGQRAFGMGYVTRYVPGMLIYHPARPDFASLTVKWQRQISHDFASYRIRHASLLRWYAKALAVVASIAVSGVQLLLSDRLSGLGNRLRGLAILTRIRLFRARQMLGKTRSSSEFSSWNR